MKINPTQRELNRFWRSVTKNPDGCWICRLNPSGIYSRISACGIRMMGHVFSYLVAYGELEDGLKVCHECNTPRCVNPDHLRADTQYGNMRQMVNQGRHCSPRGEDNWQTIVSDVTAVLIRERLFSEDISVKDLAGQLGVTYQCVWNIARGRVRKHLPGPIMAPTDRRFLSVFEVVQIRSLAKAGVSGTKISQNFNIHPAVISNVVRGAKRRDVDFLLPH